MDETKKNIIRELVESELDRAEEIWKIHGETLVVHDSALGKSSIKASLKEEETISSKIPGNPFVTTNQEKVGTFISLVADMRDSSSHLNQAISIAKVQMTQRVYFETSALLPALEATISFFEGGVTEYLGDGVLAFFKIVDTKGEERDEYIRKAYRAAKDCLNTTRHIVNAAIEKRYSLPHIDIGIGMGVSNALIGNVGIEDGRHAKAIGRCVYDATKLSGGRNIIVVSELLKSWWPKATNGKGLISFSEHTDRKSKVKGYKINVNESSD